MLCMFSSSFLDPQHQRVLSSLLRETSEHHSVWFQAKIKKCLGMKNEKLNSEVECFINSYDINFQKNPVGETFSF